MNIKIINTFLLTYISMGNVIGNLKPWIRSTEFKIIINLRRRPPADVFKVVNIGLPGFGAKSGPQGSAASITTK